jgi:hypothetical protein
VPQSGPGGPRSGSDTPPDGVPVRYGTPHPPQQPPQFQQQQYLEQQYPADQQYPAEQHPPQPHAPQGPWQRQQYQSQQYQSRQPGPGDSYSPDPYYRDSYNRGPYNPDPNRPELDPRQDFRNPRTGSDYRHGDDYSMPLGHTPDYPTQPGGYGPLSGWVPDPPGEDYTPPGQDGGPPVDEPPRRGRKSGGGKPGRFRRMFRRPTVRVILALLLVCCCWLAFSIGQALTAPSGGTLASKLSEWARDHYLGPVVTFGEWLTYDPPKVGGKPQFSLSDPQGKLSYKREHDFQADVPKRLSSPAGDPLPGEGEWRLVETVHGEPALFTTFLRVDSVHTSYAAGIASFDQRLVSFRLHPGAEDPGQNFGDVASWIPPGARTGLLATFNGGFKLDSAGGGFYLNGATRGTLTSGVASVVYYRDGTIKIGEWGRDVGMSSDVVGVRQNLKLIVNRGQVPASVDQDVETSWGATLGGAYYVWRSGIGETKDGRIIFVYGPSLSVHSLADLLHRAGAVEGMQLDINPYWMSFEYYQAHGHPADPSPEILLPTQQQTALRYYSPYSRDFTAVYAR